MNKQGCNIWTSLSCLQHQWEWKQPLGYALVNGACPKDEMDKLLRRATDKLQGTGLKVLEVASDMGSNFQCLAKYLNIMPENHGLFIITKSIL